MSWFVLVVTVAIMAQLGGEVQQTAAVDGTQAEHTFYTSPLEGTVYSLLELP